MCQIARGMRHLHSRRIVHLDLSPANVLSTTKGLEGAVMKVCDFGLSRSEDSITSILGCGKWPYMAPSFKGDKKPIDVYAFAILCYFLWTGNRPYHSEEETGAILYHLCQHAQPLSAFLSFLLYSSDDLFCSFPCTALKTSRLRLSPEGLVKTEYLRPDLTEAELCPEPVRLLIEACWSHDAELRPSFHLIVDFLEGVMKGETPDLLVLPSNSLVHTAPVPASPILASVSFPSPDFEIGWNDVELGAVLSTTRRGWKLGKRRREEQNCSQEELSDCFRSYIRLMRYSHPHIARVWGYSISHQENEQEEEEEEGEGEGEGVTSFRLILPYLGIRLDDYVKIGKSRFRCRFTLYQKFKLLEQVARILKFLHSRKTILRVIRPWSFYVSGDHIDPTLESFNPTVTLLDLDTAHSMASDGTTMTRRPTWASYTAPEDIGLEPEAAFSIDLFGFAFLIYHVLHSCKPFYSRDETAKAGNAVEKLIVQLLIEGGIRPTLGKLDLWCGEFASLIRKLWERPIVSEMSMGDVVRWFEVNEELFRTKYGNVAFNDASAGPNEVNLAFHFGGGGEEDDVESSRSPDDLESMLGIDLEDL